MIWIANKAMRAQDFLTTQVLLGHIGKPEEIAKAALASDDSSFVSDAALFADGGQAQV
jgi:NAD(P)-dependent dehydrogenase (short-subunit alcohol dehydrogenase family)